MRLATAAGLALAATLLAPAPAGARDFPRDFQWGVATAGFQTEMGRGRDVDRGSDWWAWTHDRANVAGGTVTADRPENGPGFLARYRSDLDLASRRLHLRAFRLGIEWSRIFPRSTRRATGLRELDRLANHRALRRYRAILEGIRARGMTPWVTLNHFTLPRWTHDALAARDAFARTGADDPPPTGFGPRGWLDRSTVTEFRKYAGYLAWKLGDVVDRWITLNEPQVVVVSGYVNIPGIQQGNFPPGAFNWAAAIEATLNLADANAAAYDAVKARDPRSRVGLVQNMIAFTPADPSSALDRTGARHADYIFNRIMLDAAVKGRRDRDADGRIEAGERNRRLAGKADFIGVNYYFRGRVTGLGAPLTQRIPVLDFTPATSYRSALVPSAPPCPTTCSEFGNEIYPDGFRQVLRTAGRYRLPVVVTENGISDSNDDQRPAFLRSHLRRLRAAMRAKEADVRGYFHWSLTDNFEWSAGYTQRFGLYRYDPRTLRRTARPSARLFARIARTGSLP
jgi:beta-glucosidase/6-phospho-beta-glucosidase/beta-galactosidase